MSEAELASDRQDVSDYERRVATRRAAHRGLRRLGRLNCQKPVSVSETEGPRFSSADRSEAASKSRRYGFSISAKPSATTSDAWLL
jgi:hypothetical protein